MKNCIYFEKLINRWLDGDLPLTGRQELMAHVRTCPACRARLDAFTVIRDAMTEEIEPPEDLAELVMDRIRTESQKNTARAKKRPLWQRWAAAACLAVVIGSSTWMALQSGVLRMDKAAAPMPTQTPAAEPRALNETENTDDSPAEPSETGPAAGPTTPVPAGGGAGAPSPMPTPDNVPQSEDISPAEGTETAFANAEEAVTVPPTADTASPWEPEEPPMPLPEEPPEPMPENAQTALIGQSSQEMSVAKAGPAAPPPVFAEAYGPEGAWLGSIDDTAGLKALIDPSDPVPGNLNDITWAVICSVSWDEMVYTFAADADGEHLVWWTAEDPVVMLSGGTADDLQRLIGS